MKYNNINFAMSNKHVRYNSLFAKVDIVLHKKLNID